MSVHGAAQGTAPTKFRIIPCTWDIRDLRRKTIYWMHDAPSSVEPTGKTNPDGLAIYDFEFPSDATVGMEIVLPITLGEAGRIQNADVDTQAFTSIAKTNPASAVWGAFTLGLGIGKWLDDSYGLSDKISDWLAGTGDDESDTDGE